MELFVIAIFGIIFGAFSATIADNKGYKQGNWAAAGFFFGPIGFLASIGLPDLKQRKYMRLLLEHYGVALDSTVTSNDDDSGDNDAERRQILGGK